MTTQERDMMHYYAEEVKPGYSIIRCDMVIDGELVESTTSGSPAPTQTVQSYIARNYGAEGKRYLA